MTKQEFLVILEKLTEQTKYIYYHLMGEPLTHPELPEFIKMAGTYGYKSIITTNGTLLEKCGDSLIRAGAYKVNISLHSFEKQDSYEQQKKYIDTCIDFAQKASEQGVLCILRLWNKTNNENAPENALHEYTMQILHERFPNDWSVSVRGARIHDKLHLEYGNRFDWPDANIDSLGEKVFCHGLSDQFAILCDGTVTPCCLDAEGDIALGNIFESDIRTILTSDRAIAIKQGFSKKTAVEDLCRRCGYARRFKI